MNRKTTSARALALLLCLLMLASCFTGCSKGKTDSPAAGPAIGIHFTVVHGDGSEKTFDVSTSAENLREALEAEGLIAGEESQYGLYVKTVDGETVNDSNQEWWCLTKGGEDVMTGVDSTPIADGDAFEFTFTVGY